MISFFTKFIPKYLNLVGTENCENLLKKGFSSYFSQKFLKIGKIFRKYLIFPIKCKILKKIFLKYLNIIVVSNNNFVNHLYNKLKFPHFQTALNQGRIRSSNSYFGFLTIFVPNQAKLPNKNSFELSNVIFKTNLFLSS